MVPGCRLGRGATCTHHRNGGGGRSQSSEATPGLGSRGGGGGGDRETRGAESPGRRLLRTSSPPSTARAHRREHQGAVHLPAAPGPARSSSPRAWWPGRQGVRPAAALEGNRALRAGVPTCAQDSRCGRCAARCAVSAAGEGVGDLSPGLPQRLFAAQPCGPSCLSSLTVSLPPSPQVLPPSLCPPEPELSSPPLSRRPAQRRAPPPARPSPPGPSRGLRAPGLVSELPRLGGGGGIEGCRLDPALRTLSLLPRQPRPPAFTRRSRVWALRALPALFRRLHSPQGTVHRPKGASFLGGKGVGEAGWSEQKREGKEISMSTAKGYKLLPVPCFCYIEYLNVLLSLLRPQQYSEEAWI